ncbi:hypothetical protein [Stenotrophomonas sp.]|uniref:hypothetical protein n=1 Tax=Stenotrophomonas sp. TaxID=69392 RepID=UPI00289C3E01|nr:hypothetical protein [Stenotrophomonas sp.]
MNLEPIDTSTTAGKATQTQALIQLYHTINGPRTAGRKWVTYSRPQVEAMMDVLKQILQERGCELRAELAGEAS